MYFVGFDIEFVGLKIALQMQSVFLYLSGFLSVLNWMYARKHELTSDLINEQEEEYMFFQLLPEPSAVLFSLPFAALGAELWSLSFLIILPLSYIFGKLGKRN